MVKRISYALIKVVLILIMFQFVLVPVCHASFWSEILESGNKFLSDGKNAHESDTDATIDDTEVQKQFNKIYNVLFTFGVALSVLIGAILGIKYMIGTVEEQAKIKETLVPYIIGCIIVFGAFGIWKIVVVIGGNIINEETTTPEVQITWEDATSAKQYIDAGGDLTVVGDEKLLAWYGQLSRLSGNRGTYTEYYEKVKEEVNRRGGYNALSDKVHKSN